MQQLSCQPAYASSACKGEVCWIEICPGAALESPLLSWQPEASLAIFRPPMLFPQHQRISSYPLSLPFPAVLARMRSAAFKYIQALRSRGLCSPCSLTASCQPYRPPMLFLQQQRISSSRPALLMPAVHASCRLLHQGVSRRCTQEALALLAA